MCARIAAHTVHTVKQVSNYYFILVNPIIRWWWWRRWRFRAAAAAAPAAAVDAASLRAAAHRPLIITLDRHAIRRARSYPCRYRRRRRLRLRPLRRLLDYGRRRVPPKQTARDNTLYYSLSPLRIYVLYLYDTL